MAERRTLTDDELRVEGARYVHERMGKAGGSKEAACGLWHKTIPIYLALDMRVTWLGGLTLLSRAVLLVAAAVTPTFVRRVLEGKALPSDAGAWEVLKDTFTRLTIVDYVAGALAVFAVFIPKILEALKRKEIAKGRANPADSLHAALSRMPPFQCDEGNNGHTRAINGALHHALCALREEVADILDEKSRTRMADATLLEFAVADGSLMRVRTRTVTHEQLHRAVHSFRFMAYHVAKAGRPMVEHDFLHAANPFPPKRLTVQGQPDVEYRSVLYLPVIWSEPQHGPGDVLPVDKVMGVICVHCEKPYRFWRWGDHKKPRGGFGNVAYQRSMPYIALIARLMEPTSHKVNLEPQ